MLCLVTGVPGSGKSLYAVGELLKEYLDINEQEIKEGRDARPIYSDIDGLNIEGILPAPDDWRDCPDGSIVFYDECQQKYPPDGQGRSSRSDIQEFETHRHRGFDIILITQHPKLLHAHIRRLVNRHYHIIRMYGTQNAKVFAKDGHIDIDKSAQLEKNDNWVWSYPKEFFGKYKSATIHTHKAHVPKWAKRSLYGMAVLIVFLFIIIPKASAFFFRDGDTENIEVAETTSNEYDLSEETPVSLTPVNSDSPVACMANADSCVCYNSDGYKLEISFRKCTRYTEDFMQYINL